MDIEQSQNLKKIQSKVPGNHFVFDKDIEAVDCRLQTVSLHLRSFVSLFYFYLFLNATTAPVPKKTPASNEMDTPMFRLQQSLLDERDKKWGATRKKRTKKKETNKQRNKQRNKQTNKQKERKEIKYFCTILFEYWLDAIPMQAK